MNLPLTNNFAQPDLAHDKSRLVAAPHALDSSMREKLEKIHALFA
jgi:hypothetical protein